MEQLLKEVEYKGQKYEIMKVGENEKWFVQVFIGGNPFSPYLYSIDNKVHDVGKVEDMLGHPLLDELISIAEEDIHLWADNKDKIKS